ncbi:MAG: biopolymer transporter ExbD [Bacteroidetes bacterium]|jgi:biopolymer transport protein ExbD|nr:biopolymer transporter ExbD [Bacteroidota bacterium]
MAIKKTSKVRADFSMASLTDIIFLLLIFFLLTSTVVAPNALKLVLPKHSEQTLAKQTVNVYIDADNNYFISEPDGSGMEPTSAGQLETLLASKLSSFPKYEATIVIKADENIPIKDITSIMSMGNRLRQKVILATSHE